MATLQITGADGSTHRAPIGPVPVRVGRGPHNDLTIQHPKVSSVHLAVWSDGDGIWAEDLGSKNGTVHAGVPLKAPALVHPGDQLLLGGAIEAQILARSEAEVPEVREDPWAAAVADLQHFVDAGGVQSLLRLLVHKVRVASGVSTAWAVAFTVDSEGISYTALAPKEAGSHVPPPEAFQQSELGRAALSRTPTWTAGGGFLPVGHHAILGLDGPLSAGARPRLEALCTAVGTLIDRELATGAGATRISAPTLPGLVGNSPGMLEVSDLARAFAPMPWPILLLGETGTGKTAVARALHALSDRAGQPLIERNCATIPSDLAESTLFGHERGAFTGAQQMHQGWVGEVGNGTLFLDEIGELPPAVQAKMLTLIQDGRYERVGGRQTLPFRGRIVAATNRPIDEADDAFRRDLYSRLAACVIRIPPLRDRVEDIPALAMKLFERNKASLRTAGALQLSDQAIRFLVGRRYTDANIRELENLLRLGIARAMASRSGQVLAPHVSPPGAAHPPRSDGETEGLKDATEAFQRTLVLRALTDSDWQIAETARALKVTRQTLYRLLERLEIDVESIREG